VRSAPAAACATKSTRVSNHRYAPINRHSLHDGLRLISRSPRGSGSFAPVVRGSLHDLSASVGAPGPHAFAVRFRRRPSCVAKASTASRPTFVTTRTPLLPRRDGGKHTQFLIFRKRNICAARTDNPNRLESAHEIRILAHAFFRPERRSRATASGKIELSRPTSGKSVLRMCRHAPCMRGIQYTAAFRFHRERLGVLERPPSRTMTVGGQGRDRAVPPPIGGLTLKWWARGACHRVRIRATRWLCPRYGASTSSRPSEGL